MKHKTSRFAFNAWRWWLALGLFITATIPGFAEYFVIRNYDVRVQVDQAGVLHFTETIDVEFLSERHGIFRAIPLVNRIEGKTKELLLEDIQVDGWRFSEGRENSNLILKIGDPNRLVGGRQTYVIRYQVPNGLNFFKDHTELYWDLLGIGWEVPVDHFAFDLEFPPSIPLSYDDIRVYSGPPGSTTTGDVEFQLLHQQQAPHLMGQTKRVFTPGEAVTVAVRLPKEAFPQPDPWNTWFRLHGILLLPVALLGSAITLLFRSRNRRQAIMVELQPPLDISPAVAGGFIDNSVDNNDVLSLVPLLAEKGYLRMEVSDEVKLWVFSHREIHFIRLKPADDQLQPFERQFLEALFENGNDVDLDDLKDKFYTHMISIRSSVKSWIDRQEWYTPEQRKYRIIAVVLALVCGAAGLWVLKTQNTDGLWLLGTAVLIFILSRFFHQRNPAGNQIYTKLEGFRRFMVKVDRPVLERLLKEDPQYFDKTLPYAVAFGEVQNWTKQFEGLLTQPPAWYYSRNQSLGPQQFSWDTFSSNFSTEINTINSVFGSSPSSSSGGGGSSGGGSGGGGGGSW